MSILIGVNDVWHEISRENGVCADKYFKIYDMLIDEVKSALPDIKIMILEPFVLKGSATEENWEAFDSEVRKRASMAKKIAEKYKVREMAGEHIIVMPGTYGADMTRVISLNATSLYLWQELQGREFEVADVVALLVEHYDVDAATAERDAAAWMEQLRSCGVVE